MIRELRREDIAACADIMCRVYNNEMWQCRWSAETAEEYLSDLFEAKKFIGYVLDDSKDIIGAVFAHEKIWWNNSEVFVDEMFVSPGHQHRGYGSMLMNRLELYVREKKLAGITLSTNRFAPAADFYRARGFSDCGHVLFMAKEI
ncbi:MAG: GNAT family N-acetyltransferase [Clostridia bacterium]|nr:GNAT family N-acetyltransferase [Clostridia bacterium]